MESELKMRGPIINIDELYRNHRGNAEILEAMETLDKFRCIRFEILEYCIIPESDYVSILGKKEDLDGEKRQFAINISLSAAKKLINGILETNIEEIEENN